MADEIAKLGFDIDTKAMDEAKQSADETAKSIGKVGDAAQKAGTQWGPPVDNLSASMEEAAKKAEEMAAKFEKFKQGLGTIKPPGPLLPPTPPGPNPLEKIPEDIKKASKAAEDSKPGFLKLGEGLKGAIDAAREFAASYGVSGGVGAANVTSSLTGVLEVVGKVAPMFGAMGVAIAAGTAIATAAIGSFVGLQAALAMLVDKQAVLTARMQTALGDTGNAREMLGEIEERSIRAGRSVDETARAFMRFAQTADTLTLTNREILDMVQGVQTLGNVSGLSGEEVSGVMEHLARMFQTGTVGARELRSVMQTMPTLVRDVAEALGKTPDQLREMARQGQLTGDMFARGIVQSLQKINEQGQQMPATVGGAFRRLTEEAERFFSRLGELTGASPMMRAVLNQGADSMAGYTRLLGTGSEEELLRDQIARLEERTAGRRPPATDEAAVAAERQAQAARAEAAIRAAAGGGGSMFAIRPQATAADQQNEALRRDAEIQARELEQLESFKARLVVVLAETAAARAAAAEAEARRQRAQPLGAADQTVQQLDELAGRIATLNTQAAALTAGIGALQNQMDHGEAEAGATERMNKYQQMLVVVNERLRTATDAIGKFRQETEQLARAQDQGGGGGGTAIMQQVLQLQQQQKDRGNQVSDQEALNTVLQRHIVTANADIGVMVRQSQMQAELSAARRSGREELVRVTADQAAENFIMQRFGTTLERATPAIREFYDIYRQIVADSTRRDLDTAAADAAAPIEEAVASARAQMAVIQQGAYEMRRVAMEIQVARDTSGAGGARREQFNAEEALKAQQNIQQIGQQWEDAEARRRAATSNAPAANLIYLRQELEIRRALQNVATADRPATEAAMRMKFDAERSAQLAEQLSSMQEQTTYAQGQLAIAGQTGDQLARSTAILDTNRRLQQEGVNLSSAAAQAQRDQAVALADVNSQLARERQHAQDIQKIWSDAAQGIQQALTDAFDTAFKNGTISGKEALDILGSFAQKMVQTVLQATVFSPLEQFLKQFGTAALQGLGNSIFGAPSANFGAFPTTISSGITSPIQAVPASMLHQGGMVGDFSSGGRVVPYSVFANARRYHNGGMIGGDEVPIIAQRGERVMTASQQASMGGVNLIVNDMRGTGAPPIEQKDRGQGVDGKRMIEITVRDTTRKLLKSGDLDRDMANSYGASRRLTRR